MADSITPVPAPVRLSVLAGLVLLLLAPDPIAAQAVQGDGLARNAIFSGQHVEEAALELRARSARMTPEERYEFLSNHVLPGSSHPTLRLGLEFVPTDPAPPVRDEFAISAGERRAGVPDGRAPIASGGYPVSPALDLIDVATELERLDEVRSRIAGSAAEGEQQQRIRLALLMLTDVARGDFESARTSLDELSARVRGGAFDSYVDRWPETLVVWEGVRHEATYEPARDLLMTILQDQVRSGYARGPERWDRGLTALAGRLNVESPDGPRVGSFPAAPDLRNWSPVSRTTALTRADGFPNAGWRPLRGGVEKLAGHNEDYLMYRIPLRGDFEVECDLSTFDWRDCHLSVAGVWVAPAYDRSSCAIGEFRSARQTVDVDPPLSRMDEWIRYRVVVRDGTCTTYFNGRPVHRELLPEEHDPWLAIRSPWYAHSVVRGLRITGDPVFPERVRMTALADLKGWTAYFSEAVGEGRLDWRQLGDPDRGGGIVGRREPALAGSNQESLLRYQRPLLEDGAIEYDFYYSAGESHVHPALDRRAFLLTPDGVRIHWITDGPFDRTGQDPANLIDEPESRRGPDRLPLIANDWNRFRLSLTGDVVDLVLNGQLVYHGPLEPTNQRTFGLFHYADRTEARVRNVVWTGDWPRALPPVAEQQLAGAGTDFLDERLDGLPAVFEHDFARDGLPAELFQVIDNNPESEVDVTADGLRIVAASQAGYVPTLVSAKLRVQGDFDIIAAFDSLTTEVSPGGSSGIALRSILDDPNEQRTVYRGLVRNFDPEGRQIMQAVFVRNAPEGLRMTFHGTTAEEATSGRLRMARRGETVYCLLAEGDSSQFRLVSEGPLPAQDLRLDGVRLTAATQGESGSVSVVWKRLVIRAERIGELEEREGE